MTQRDYFADLPNPRGLDPLYFDRRRSVESALKWTGLASGIPRNCIDVGANVGQTLQNFTNWWPKSRCVSFEPLPSAYDALNLLASSLGDRVVARQIGLSDSSGTAVLYASRSQSTQSSLHRVERSITTVKSHRGLRGSPSSYELPRDVDEIPTSVRVATLDGHLESTSPENRWFRNGVDLLKSDTEGWDLNVLRGARKTLKNTRVVIVEWHFDDIYGKPARLGELDSEMSAAGLKLWDIAHIYKDLTALRTLWVDLIFARPPHAR